MIFIATMLMFIIYHDRTLRRMHVNREKKIKFCIFARAFQISTTKYNALFMLLVWLLVAHLSSLLIPLHVLSLIWCECGAAFYATINITVSYNLHFTRMPTRVLFTSVRWFSECIYHKWRGRNDCINASKNANKSMQAKKYVSLIDSVRFDYSAFFVKFHTFFLNSRAALKKVAGITNAKTKNTTLILLWIFCCGGVPWHPHTSWYWCVPHVPKLLSLSQNQSKSNYFVERYEWLLCMLPSDSNAPPSRMYVRIHICSVSKISFLPFITHKEKGAGGYYRLQ